MCITCLLTIQRTHIAAFLSKLSTLSQKYLYTPVSQTSDCSRFILSACPMTMFPHYSSMVVLMVLSLHCMLTVDSICGCNFMIISHVLVPAHCTLPLIGYMFMVYFTHHIFVRFSSAETTAQWLITCKFRLHSFGHNFFQRINFVTVASGGNRGKFKHSSEPSTKIVRCLDQTILWAKCNGGIINSVDVQYAYLDLHVLGHHKCQSSNCDVTFYSILVVNKCSRSRSFVVPNMDIV